MSAQLIVAQRLRGTGTSTRTLERGVGDGRFVRLRPGVYLPTSEWVALTARERHLALMSALVETPGRRLVFSHESAALLHGLPLLEPPPARPQLTEPTEAPVRHPRVGTRAHYASLADDEVEVRGRFEFTDLLRTVIDLAATRRFAAGFVTLDGALGHGFPTSTEAVKERIAVRGRFPGVVRVERILSTATGLAETPLESASMAFFVEHRIPCPSQQISVVVDGRTYRPDFLWERESVFGEADGRGKYDDPDEIVREKAREDDLRSVARGFVRWGWPELGEPPRLLARLARAGVYPLPRSASYS